MKCDICNVELKPGLNLLSRVKASRLIRAHSASGEIPKRGYQARIPVTKLNGIYDGLWIERDQFQQGMWSLTAGVNGEFRINRHEEIPEPDVVKCNRGNCDRDAVRHINGTEYCEQCFTVFGSSRKGAKKMFFKLDFDQCEQTVACVVASCGVQVGNVVKAEMRDGFDGSTEEWLKTGTSLFCCYSDFWGEHLYCLVRMKSKTEGEPDEAFLIDDANTEIHDIGSFYRFDWEAFRAAQEAAGCE